MKKDRDGTVDAVVRSLVDAQPTAFALIDRDFNIVACNELYAAAYTRLAPEEIVGMKCHEVSHKTTTRCELNGEECPLVRVFQEGEDVQVVHRHYDKHHNPYYTAIHGIPVRGEGGGIAFMGESMCPVTRAEELEFDEEKMVGCCPSFVSMIDNLTRIARHPAAVLIQGETGTGKELAAQFIHRKSARREQAFVTLDCTHLTSDLAANELFGHEAGAFTGSVGAKRGLLEEADRGTLFLDEIGEVPVDVQAKLLRLLDRGTYRKVGGTKELRVDFRLVCATNRDLDAMVARGEFRADLLYRINSLKVTLPPLRDRRDDLPELASFFLRKMLPSVPGPLITKAALNALAEYHFPGNMRELRHILEHAVLHSEGRAIEKSHLPAEVLENRADPGSIDVLTGFHEHANDPDFMLEILAKFNGNRRKTAAFLKMSERTLYRRLRELKARRGRG